MIRRRYSIPAGVAVSLVVAAGLGWAVAGPPPEVAPPPREAKPAKPKTTAELLVGEWKQVKQSARQEILTVNESRIEFTNRNKVTIRLITKSDGAWPPQQGTYKLEGNRVVFTVEGTTHVEGRVFEARIDEVTSDKLIFTELSKEALVLEFVRLRGKDK